ncbi:MAG: ATP-binding protein [Caldilineaceae bacterium]
MSEKFVGREQELGLLDAQWQATGARFLVLYGRRRVGKTALMSTWLQRTGANALYWVASPTSAAVQLRSFSQAVYEFANPNVPFSSDFTYTSWEQAWREVANLSRQGRLALFIDEFTYLLEVTPAIAGQLQNFWDQILSKANLFLCLSGSHLGMMKHEFLSYQAPLYGRATTQIYLQPLPFGLSRSYFPNYSAVDRVALYAMFGGVPAYWERVDANRSISYNIKTQLLTANNLMQAEPALLLHDFVSDLHNYAAILTAIANGARTPKEIAAVVGLPNVQVPKYLSVLADAGFVERRVSITSAPGARTGRHHIIDPYLRFYFRFLATRQRQFALKIQDQALAEISRHLIDFIGTHTWEELCREWVLRAAAFGKLPFMPDDVGSAWNRTVQIDVAGMNSMEKTLILGECKWTLDAAPRKVLADLVEEKTAQIVPTQGQWRIYFVGFSRSGWTNEAMAYATEVRKMLPSGVNWRCVGMQLLDLKQVDDDLANWST